MAIVKEMEIKNKRLFTYHTLSDRERKNLAILNAIKKSGPLSRSNIAELTDINIVSVSNYIKEYIARGIVFEKGMDVSSGGRRPELIELNTSGIHVIGLEVGDSEVRATAAGIDMGVKARSKLPMQEKDPAAVVKCAVELIEKAAAEARFKISDIRMIGVGMAHNKFLDIGEAIEEKTGIRARVGSDASCAAFGEKSINKNADVENLLYMYSDVGCGIVISGDIYFGAGGTAVERCFSGDAKYLRPWGIDLGITGTARREVERGVGTKIVEFSKGDVHNITKEVVIDAALINDKIALDILRNAGMNLGIRISYLVNLFNPAVVVIGGGAEKAGELLLGPIRNSVKKLALTKSADMLRIIPSTLGDDAVSLGAAALAVREIFLSA